MLLNDKKNKRTCYNCDEESHFANECPYEKRVDKPKFIKGVKPRLKPNPINDRYKRNKGRAFVGAEYLSDEEEEDEEKEAGVAGLAFSKPGSLFTYEYSKDYSTENDVGSSFMARTTQDDDSDDSASSTIVGSCLMARETKVMEPPPSLSSVLDDEAENQEELTVLKELYNVRCTLRGEALVKFDFLMDSLKEKDESIEELEYHLNDKERRFNLLRQELKTERCISQGLKQQIETYELDKVKDLETIERAQSLTQELNASKEELEVAHASLTRDLDHLERANKLVKDELKKLGKNHDLLQETYSKALESMNDSIVDKDVASSSTTFTSEHAKLVVEHVRLQEELSLHIETNTYLESLVTKYGLNYYPNESACEQATTLEENVRLKKELSKFTTTKNKMGLDDLLSKQRSNNQKYGLGYDPKPYKKNNYKKEKPAQEKNKKVTNDGKAPKGKATSGDRTGPNNHYALFVDYYGDVYANYVGPRNGYAYRGSDNLKLVLVGYVENNLYVVDLSKESPSPSTCLMAAKHDEGNDDDPSSAIKHMGIGHIRPMEVHNDDQGDGVEMSHIPKNKKKVLNPPSKTMMMIKKHPQLMFKLKLSLMIKKFEMSMMGELKFFLGFQVRQLAKGTFISQEKYVKDMLKKFNMTNASPMKTPMPVKGQLGSCDGEKDVDIKDLRTVNPYRYEQRTYTGGDKFFWTKTQAALWVGYYDNTHVCMKNGAVVKPKAINPEELALHEATKYRFVVQTLKGMGLYDLVCLKPDDDQEDPTYCPLLVRQFYCTVFFHDDADRTMTWMTGREKYSCTYTQFCEAMGFDGGRATGIRKIDGCDLIYCELKRAVMDRMTPNYAQYVQRLINHIVPAPLNTLDERVIMAPFKFPTPEGRPEVPSMMPANERRSKEHHDPAASSSYSRRPKHGAARFFSSMWQMCKNTNDVAHQSLALNQETRRRQNEFMATRNVPVPPLDLRWRLWLHLVGDASPHR
ncbi:hypothetical protein QYE76_004121 [Lolium multiflorum]|uniref:CCHC-type domain-containing protein n=1 Tax=Lolium multiflorum TaxID=4521 RepID=A0AAD8W267_LOLMU|nr:hypothetical protein QYE76_004121 [Lolium multiflorum]